MAKLQRAEFKDGFLYLVSQSTLKLLEYSTETILDKILKSSRTIFKENLSFRRNKTGEYCAQRNFNFKAA